MRLVYWEIPFAIRKCVIQSVQFEQQAFQVNWFWKLVSAHFETSESAKRLVILPLCNGHNSNFKSTVRF